MSNAPSAGSRTLSLSRLREVLRDAKSKSLLEELIQTVANDARAGARAIRAQAERRLENDRLEDERIAGLMALRNDLESRGVHGIAGIDEVGVGPLAGSVIAAAVILPSEIQLRGLDDSKRVRPARRETLAEEIRGVALGVGIGECSVEEIDQVGIYQAALEAMRRSVASLSRSTEVGHLLVDARKIPGVSLPQTSIIKGDQKDASIAAASIVAKVYRDAQMERMGERYPAYGFERHMGYGTAFHMAALEEHGPCPIHRRSFAPVANAERRDRGDRARPASAFSPAGQA
ncbi:MAG: ribonuclease HII [Myxococcales bacterium]|nr:ribonuclease HII [Myxococcales bacterium]HIK84280.1 ribonuclease HII [Myxococcales bacterium]